ncbi:hypothetical protein I4U23_009178 [Adineta vaga]|nr:hypothetical protein I4U23_009178 [Adineta vaga]
MISNYYLTVQNYLEQNRNNCILPEHIKRGWNHIHTFEENEYKNRSCIIASDVQIPNSVVRQRLGTTQITLKQNMKILHKVFELPEELLKNLSMEQQIASPMDDEQLNVDWNDDDDETDLKRKKSVITTIIEKQREKRRKYEDYNYDYDYSQALPLDEIIEEIRTNIGKDLKSEELKLITQLMQIISQHKQDQVMNIFDELTAIHLIRKFGGVPKLVQKAFEQVAMKANIASIETVIDVLLEKDDTYRVAVDLLNSFNEFVKKNKHQGKVNLNDKFGDILDHDHTLFNILIKDRISRLPTSHLTTLINDLQTVRNLDRNQLNKTHDEQLKYLSDQLNMIFTRAHFDGIKTTFHSMNSHISQELTKFIDQIERSLAIKLTEHETILIESYIHDHLSSLTENELKMIYERLAQQGTLKRH